MAEKIGRLGFLGLAVEATAGTPESTPDVFIPFTENSVRGHHEPLFGIHAKTSRIKDNTSVAGKRWGEGSVTMYLDSINAGYLFKLALGAEARTQLSATPPVHDHLMIPTVSGNAVTAATLWDNKGVDSEQYSYAAIDVCEVEVTNDGIATINAAFMAKAPATVSAPALTTTSGTLYTWKDMNARFGATVAAAKAASPTKLTNFKLSIANSLELNYKSGSNQPDTITYGPVEVTGSYTLFFESVTDRDAYYNLTKKSMVVTLTGAGLGVGYTEQIEIVLKKITLEDIDMETGLDDLFALTANFRAEWDQDQAGFLDVTVRNGKATDYT
jgi:hypothetical protein